MVTHPRIFKTPTPLALAVAQVDAWFASPTLVHLAETTTYWMTLRALVEPARITGPRVHDAGIAAVRQSHAVTELWTADRDFSAFPTLRVRNPLLP